MVRQVPVDTATEITVVPDLANERVTASFSRSGMKVWFANTFGINSVGITASATAEAAEKGKTASCVKPFLVPDAWNEKNQTTQDVDKDKIWDGGANPRQGGEDWKYEPDAPNNDTYVPFDPTASTSAQALQTGYGSNWRKATNGGLEGDYGMQMLIKPQLGNGQRAGPFYMLFDLQSGLNTRQEINTCLPQENLSVGQDVPIKPGGTTGQVKHGVDDLVALDPNAKWDPASLTVVHKNGSAYPNWIQSPRVITIALFDPIFIKNGEVPGGNAMVTINNFARMWLNDSDGNDNVTAIFLGFAPGGPSGETAGPLVKFIRLVK
jgi:hypothetical protein